MKHSIILIALAMAISAHAQSKPDLQAHRGGRGLMPENSIPAMLHAVALGARTLELDCVISSDGQVVVSHDLFMNADIMSNPDGSTFPKDREKSLTLYKMTYKEIAGYTEGGRPYPKFPEQAAIVTHKPLLVDLIDSVEAYVKEHHLKPVYYNMETKSSPAGDDIYHPKPERFVELLMGVIQSKGIASRVTIQSFDPRTLQVLHRMDAGMVTALLVENKDGFAKNIERLGFTPTIYSPNYLLVNAELVKEAHDRKVAVLPWTVDEEKDMKMLADMGVDGIISDYPDRLVKLFGSYQQ
ncbi:MAG TPA: glycerophosphodiester phosphodiesterase family protein [Puia sp.]|nr:glycerophosphodiester phosphodiesterase family protein [Puia sp.]